MTSKSYIILLALALCMSACAQKNNNTESTANQSEANVDPVEETLSSSSVTEESSVQNEETDNSSEATADKLPEVKFETTSHDFGTVKLGESKTFEFTFKNTGEADLYIVDSNVFCNCMKLTIPKEPIAPGQTGKIIMKFTGENVGEFMKNAQIYTNCKRPMIRLNIQGQVVE